MDDDPRAYMQLASALRERIRDGELKPGCRVPSIRTVNQETGRSRQTAGKAMRVLEGEGLLTLVRGLGYYVR